MSVVLKIRRGRYVILVLYRSKFHPQLQAFQRVLAPSRLEHQPSSACTGEMAVYLGSDGSKSAATFFKFISVKFCLIKVILA